LYKQVNNKVNAAITAVEKPLYNTRKKNGGKDRGKLCRRSGLKMAQNDRIRPKSGVYAAFCASGAFVSLSFPL
jgi:hypothetical protein